MAPQMPRKGGSAQKTSIPNVRNVLAVASGKGGVGKSTVAGTVDTLGNALALRSPEGILVNLALAIALHQDASVSRRLRVGILDLDVFGPSIPTLMGLQNSEDPELTPGTYQPLLQNTPLTANVFIKVVLSAH
jgi:ATP-binding protein involved in chromosome partitioning